MPPTPDLSCRSGIVAGVTLIEGRQYEVIDAFALFASVPDPVSNIRPLRCLLADKDDPWMREILALLIRQAGYDVVTTDEAATEEADIILCLAQSRAVAGVTHRPVVRLRHAQRPMGPADRSIYCLYRAACIASFPSAT